MESKDFDKWWANISEADKERIKDKKGSFSFLNESENKIKIKIDYKESDKKQFKDNTLYIINKK
jgi:hypothetical protein